MHGLYSTTLIYLCTHTCVLTDLKSVNADWLEAALKWPKVMLLNRSTMRFNNSVESGLLHCVCMTKQVFDNNFCPPGHSNGEIDCTCKLYNHEPGLFPLTVGEDDCEAEYWHLSRKIAKDIFYIVAILQSVWLRMVEDGNNQYWTNITHFIDSICNVTFNCIEETVGF